MNGITSMFSKPKENKAVAEARRKQEEAMAAQEAVTRRAQVETDKREEELSGNLATQRRAIAARRRSRGGLAFTASGGNIKNTLGG